MPGRGVLGDSFLPAKGITMNEKTELLEAALSYHEKNWSVFPINSRTKRPFVEWKSYQKDPANEEQIKQWWKTYPYAGIGLVTGKISNLIVLDVDGEEGKKYIKDKGFAPTPCVKTKRGEHYYFKHPGFSTQNFAKKKGLDLRGDGGFVILPPSKHPSGIRYEWIITPEEELADPPGWLLELITRKETGKKLPETELSGLLNGVAKGKRHDTATRIAGHFIGKGLPRNEVVILLNLWNKKNKPPLPENELTRMVADFSSAREGREEKERQKKRSEKTKAKEETKTLIPGLIHLVKDNERVHYLLKNENGLYIQQKYIKDEITYTPKQNLPIKIPTKDILNEPTDVKWDKLLEEVVSFIKNYLELPNDTDYLLLALWIFHTYLIEKFNETPILYFYGVKETGKTRAGEVLQELGFRCERLTSPTEATLFRSASYFKTSLIIDEIKLWGLDGNPEVARLIKSRYKRGLMVSRCNLDNRGEDQIEYFDVFSPLVICTTESIPDTIESRCIIFLMQKNARAEVERLIDQDLAKKLRNKLTIFRSNYLEKDLPETDQIARRRLNEIMSPLYQVLMLVDPERKEAFKMIVEGIETAKEEEEGLSLEAEFVKEIIKYKQETGEGVFLTTEITDRMNEERTEKEKISNMLTSSRIKRLGFQKIRLKNSRMGFRINSGLLKKLSLQFGLDITTF